MKTLIASAILLASSSAMAHDIDISNDQCNIDLNAGVRISADKITISQHDKTVFSINNNQDLIIDGQKQSLTNYQASLVKDYSESVRAIVPEMKEVASEAIDLAMDGVNLAFNELLGEGNRVGEELTGHLNEIKTEVEERFSSNQEFYFDQDGFSGDEFFGEEFEQKIEKAVESTVQNSMGTLLIAVGQELLMSGGSVDALETRMETFGERIEQEMESRAEVIEAKAHGLCNSVHEIDQLEEALKAEFNQLSDFDGLKVKQHGHNKA